MISSFSFQGVLGRLTELARAIVDDLVIAVDDVWVSVLSRMVATVLVQSIELQHFCLPRSMISPCLEASCRAWELHRRLTVWEFNVNGTAVPIEVRPKTACIENHRKGFKGVVGAHDVASSVLPPGW